MKLEREIANKHYSETYAYQMGVSETKSVLRFYESVLDETSSFELPNAN